LSWNLDGWKCSQCERELVPSNLEDVHGTAGDISITCRHLPCLRCPEDHERAPTSPDFEENLLDALFGEGGIAKVRHKGLLSKVPVCPRCDRELPQTPAQSWFRVALVLRQPGARDEVEFEHTDVRRCPGVDPSVFCVELLGPGVECVPCGVHLAIRGAELTSPVRQALARALESQFGDAG
jgi:hypothetical protein